MIRVRTFLIAFVVCGLSIGGFLAGRASAQQTLPQETPTHYQFPRSWGDFRTVVTAPGGYAYIFEDVDGSIRTVSVNSQGIIEIQVTKRYGNAPRGGPGTVR